MTTPLSSIGWVFFGAFIGSFGAALLKAGASRIEKSLPSIVFNYRLITGVAAYLLSAVFFVLGLRQGELSILYPMVALGYMWTILWSRLFFGEPLTANKFMGLGMILAGVAFLGIGSR